MSANEVDARAPAQVSPTAPFETEAAGLSEAEAARRLAHYGENALSEDCWPAIARWICA